MGVNALSDSKSSSSWTAPFGIWRCGCISCCGAGGTEVIQGGPLVDCSEWMNGWTPGCQERDEANGCSHCSLLGRRKFPTSSSASTSTSTCCVPQSKSPWGGLQGQVRAGEVRRVACTTHGIFTSVAYSCDFLANCCPKIFQTPRNILRSTLKLSMGSKNPSKGSSHLVASYLAHCVKLRF